MDESASFETRAVLAPRRARVARLALLVPVVALVAIAWAGLNGPSSDSTAAASPGPNTPQPTTVSVPAVVPAPPVEAAYPAKVVGIDVQKLGDLQLGGIGFDEIVAIAGWYVPTAITDCPALAAIYRDGALPYLRGDRDKLAFCVRSGVLYPSRPDLANVAATGVAVTVVVGVVMPLELEIVDAQATQVVVLGRFSKSSDGCRVGIGCSRELLVDHVGWTPGA
ncbi:MAG TPA: hypothetical protein VIF63_08445 [Candidatus Limnocylindrales bacterium]|jgi:hypothetical protein